MLGSNEHDAPSLGPSSRKEQVSPALVLQQPQPRVAEQDGGVPAKHEPAQAQAVGRSPSAQNAAQIEPPQMSGSRNTGVHLLPLSVGENHGNETDDSGDEEVWDVADADANVGLWVPPSLQHRYVTVDVAISPLGCLGIAFRCNQRRKRRRRRRSRKRRFLVFENGITVSRFDFHKNPHLRHIVKHVPVGAHLQLWDGEPVMSRVQLSEIVEDLKLERQMRPAEFSADAGIHNDAGPKKVALTFALPEAR